jgi:hypothetical protein
MLKSAMQRVKTTLTTLSMTMINLKLFVLVKRLSCLLYGGKDGSCFIGAGKGADSELRIVIIRNR